MLIDMDFNLLPLAVKARLLAAHLKTHMQMVEDMSADLQALYRKYVGKSKEVTQLEARLERAEKEKQAYETFVNRHGLKKAFNNFKHNLQ